MIRFILCSSHSSSVLRAFFSELSVRHDSANQHSEPVGSMLANGDWEARPQSSERGREEATGGLGGECGRLTVVQRRRDGSGSGNDGGGGNDELL